MTSREVEISDSLTVKVYKAEKRRVDFNLSKGKLVNQESEFDSFFLECPDGTFLFFGSNCNEDSFCARLKGAGNERIEAVFADVSNPEAYQARQKEAIEERRKGRELERQEWEEREAAREKKRKEDILARFSTGEKITREEFIELAEESKISFPARTKGWFNDYIVSITKGGAVEYLQKKGKTFKIPCSFAVVFNQLKESLKIA